MTTPRVRLGMTEYTLPAISRVCARALFLSAVEHCVPEAVQALATVEPDDAALDAWARQWGFEDEWAREIATKNVALWRENPDLSRGCFHWRGGGAFWAPALPALMWDPTVTSEADFRATVEAYIALGRTRVQRSLTKDDLRHFEWLALHHCARWDYDRICERYQGEDILDISAVSKAIRPLAALVGITLRRTRGRKLSLTPDR